MIRTTPDPVFTEAGRAALLDLVRSEHRTATRARRPRVHLRDVLIGGVVVAAATATLVVVHAAPERTAEPARTASTSTAPTTPSPARSTSTPAPSVPATLVGPTGSKVRTEAQIRAWAASIGASAVTTEQDVIITRCMAEQGFLYDPIRQRTGDLRAGRSGMTTADEARWDLAYGGTAQPGDYTWQTAGCDGLAVHETGMDGAD